MSVTENHAGREQAVQDGDGTLQDSFALGDFIKSGYRLYGRWFLLHLGRPVINGIETHSSV